MINLQRANSAAIGLRQLGCGTSVQLQPAGGAKIKLASTEGGSSVLVGLSSHGPQIKVQNTGFKVALQPAAASQLIRVKIGLAQAGPAGPAGGAAVAGVDDLIYTGDKLTRINKADGTYKLMIYTGDLLVRVDHVKTGQTVRKDFTYAADRLEAVETLFI